MRPALIATDLDGTFLGHNGMAHPGNLEAARRIHEAGVEFVVATGRPRRWLEQLDPLLDLDPIVIASNGGSIGRLSAPEPDHLFPLPMAAVDDFLAALPAHLKPAFAVEYADGWGREEAYPASEVRSVGGIVAPIEALLAEEPFIKLLVHTRGATTEELSTVALEAAGEGLTCTFSWAHQFGTVEVSAPGVSKGAALTRVLDGLGLQPSDCAAFGDMPNDLEMLRLVGHPFVMAGAHPSMFEHGFTVIGHHHEGAVGTQLLAFLDAEPQPRG